MGTETIQIQGLFGWITPDRQDTKVVAYYWQLALSRRDYGLPDSYWSLVRDLMLAGF